MPFKFNADETVEAGLRRIVIEQAQKASQAARGGAEDPQAAIHSIRRRCKKIRAALRLVRASFDDYRKENIAVRDAARKLGQLRDRPVALQTYDMLVREEAASPDPKERENLLARLATTSTEDPIAALIDFAAAIDALSERAQRWTVRRSGFKALEGGIGQTYHRTRKALKRAHRHPTAVNLHDWRKLTKYHGHHLGLISASAPHILLASRSAANDLADVLGRHHDLDMLAGYLGEETVLAPVLIRRKAELEAESFRLGAELTAESPEAFRARCANYWEEWTAEKQ